MPLWATRAALAAIAALLLIQFLIIAPRVETIALVASALWMALPGVALVRMVLVEPGTRAGAWLVGPAIGFGTSVFGLLMLWALGLQNWMAMAIAPAFTWLLARVVSRVGAPGLKSPAIDRHDVVAVCAALIVVPAITWLPYDHVAEPVADGVAYRAYFTADFVWAMSVASELAKGDVPPVNPFLSGEPVRYYWMAHLLSGALYRNVRAWGVTSEQVLLVNGLLYGVAFVALLYWLARAAGGRPLFAALAVLIGFFANSYEGLERLVQLWAAGQPLDAVTTLNIDAVTRWFYQGMAVDGLQRMLLYQPHHLTGYALGLMSLWLACSATDVTDVRVSLWSGILLGLGFLFSTFTAIIVGGAVGLVFAVRLIRGRSYAAIWQAAVLGGAPVAVAIGMSMALGYTARQHGLLMMFGLNPVAAHRWPTVLFLSFGPLLVLGTIAILRWRWLIDEGRAVGALTLSALAFYFLADVPNMGGVWVGWRSGHLLQIMFVLATAALLTLWSRQRWRWVMAAVTSLAVAAAVPTVAIDVYNAQDITNRGPGAQFPWTLVITPPEREALDWVKRATPADALVQVEPTARHAGTWAYIPAFGERRMAAGLPISMIPLRPYELMTESIRAGLFSGTAEHAHALAHSMGVDYLFFGIEEQRVYGAMLARLKARPDLFLPVFENSAVAIFGVAKRLP